MPIISPPDRAAREHIPGRCRQVGYRLSHFRYAALMALAVLPGVPAFAASFTVLATPYGLAPLALSADGAVAVGSTDTINSGFMWRADTGVQLSGSLDTRDPVAYFGDVSPDGAVALGTTATACCGRLAGTWTPAGGWVTLPASTTTFHYRDQAQAMSDDGRFIVGWHQSIGGPDTPFLYRDGVLATPAGLPVGNHPTAISADGSVIVGHRYGVPSSESAFLWSEASGYITLTPAGACCNDARAITADGSVVVGSYTPVAGSTTAFRWSFAEGLVPMPAGSGYVQNWADDISGDGGVIVGAARRASDNATVATLWDAEHGMRQLHDVLTGELGLELAGVTLTGASAISRDGRVIAGTGVNAEGRRVAWIADITPVPIPGAGWLLASGLGAMGWFRSRRPVRAGGREGPG